MVHVTLTEEEADTLIDAASHGLHSAEVPACHRVTVRAALQKIADAKEAAKEPAPDAPSND